MPEHRRVVPARLGQCQYPSSRMLNLGGCTYGTAEERAQWRRLHTADLKPGRDPNFCVRAAKWQIDGGPHLCALHAGADALEIVRRGNVAPNQGEDEMAKNTLGVTIGLPGTLEPGGALCNLRGHALRIADEIRETAREVGGDPENSARYNDATEVVRLIDQLEQISLGTYVHVLAAKPNMRDDHHLGEDETYSPVSGWNGKS